MGRPDLMDLIFETASRGNALARELGVARMMRLPEAKIETLRLKLGFEVKALDVLQAERNHGPDSPERKAQHELLVKAQDALITHLRRVTGEVAPSIL